MKPAEEGATEGASEESTSLNLHTEFFIRTITHDVELGTVWEFDGVYAHLDAAQNLENGRKRKWRRNEAKDEWRWKWYRIKRYLLPYGTQRVVDVDRLLRERTQDIYSRILRTRYFYED